MYGLQALHCGIDPTVIVTMAMKVMHNFCYTGTCGLPNNSCIHPWAHAYTINDKS